MYCENNVQHTNAWCGQNVEFLTVREYRMQHFVSRGSLTLSLTSYPASMRSSCGQTFCISLAAAHSAWDGA
jgi:hypothetical protein